MAGDHWDRQTTKPTLPSIQHLLRDIDSREKPSSTIARLRLDDDDNAPSAGWERRPVRDVDSTSGFYSQRHSQPEAIHGRDMFLRSSPSYPSQQPHSLPATYPERPLDAPPHRYVTSDAYPSHVMTSGSVHAASYGHYHDSGRTPISRQPPTHPFSGYGVGHAEYRRRLSDISTTVASTSMEDEQTPIARYAGVGPHRPPPLGQLVAEDRLGSHSSLKYECQYCGKGFNRPSSLRIHLNSHTGEKPFVCPVPSCGRSFSVLSNMRRHARVHSQGLGRDREPSSDDDSERSSSVSSTHLPLDSSGPETSGSQRPGTHRRDSSASTSSASSRKTRSHSSDAS